MSYFPIDKWRAVQLAIVDPRLSAFDGMVFARLMEHHNSKTGLCCPSIRTLADALHYSERNVRSSLSRLKKFDYVRVQKGRGMNGTNLYVLSMPRGKSEFNLEAKARLTVRNGTSPKPMNKPLKQPQQKYHAKQSVIDRPAKEAATKMRASIENAMVDLLGRGPEAWQRVQELDAEIVAFLEHYDREASQDPIAIAEHILASAVE